MPGTPLFYASGGGGGHLYRSCGGVVLRGRHPAGELAGGSRPRGSCPPGELSYIEPNLSSHFHGRDTRV